MNVFITNNSQTIDITQYITQLTIKGDYQSCVRTLNFGIISNANDKNIENIDCNLGNGVVIKHDGINIFNGFIFSRTKSAGDSVIDITAFDRGIYLKKNEAVYNVNTTPEAMVKRICTDFGITVGNISATNVTVKRKFIGNTLLDIINTLYTKASETNGKKYIIRFEDNKLCIVERSEKAVISISGKTNLMTAVMTESAENMINCVTIYDKNGNFINTVKDNENIKKFGLLQNYLKNTDGNANLEAKKILNESGITQKITIDNIGNINCITGNAVTVKEDFTGVTGLFYIDSDTHTWKNGQYFNKLTLNFNKIMNETQSGSE